jgi:hypothetical protein
VSGTTVYEHDAGLLPLAPTAVMHLAAVHLDETVLGPLRDGAHEPLGCIHHPHEITPAGARLFRSRVVTFPHTPNGIEGAHEEQDARQRDGRGRRVDRDDTRGIAGTFRARQRADGVARRSGRHLGMGDHARR